MAFPYDPSLVVDYFDELAEGEWDRLERDPEAEVNFALHLYYLRCYIQPGGGGGARGRGRALYGRARSPRLLCARGRRLLGAARPQSPEGGVSRTRRSRTADSSMS